MSSSNKKRKAEENKTPSVFNGPSHSNDLTVSQIVELQRKAHADGTIERHKKKLDKMSNAEFEKYVDDTYKKEQKQKSDKAIADAIKEQNKYWTKEAHTLPYNAALCEDSRDPPINKQPKLQNIKYFPKPTDGNPMDEFFYNWQQKWIRQHEPVNSVINDQRRDYGWRKRFLEGYNTDLGNFRKSDEYTNVKDNLYPKFREERDNKWKAEKEKKDEKLNKIFSIKKTPSHKPTEEPEKSNSNYDIIKSIQHPDTYYYHDKTNDNVRWLMPEDNIPVFESSKYPGNFYYTDKDTNKQRWVLLKDTDGGKRKSHKKKTTNNGKAKRKYKKKGTRKKKM